MYILPSDVNAPKEFWSLHKVLIDNGNDTAAYALDTWDGRRCIATRWNGNDENPVGWPRVFVHPCWQILDDTLFDAVIALLPDYRQKIEAMRFLANEAV